jgi:outer membrane usher protein
MLISKTPFLLQANGYCLLSLVLPFGYIATAEASGYTFDPALLRGSTLTNSALAKFNQNDIIAPGSYQIDLFINGEFLERDRIRFVRNSKQQVLPCFDHSQLMRFGLKSIPPAANDTCLQPGYNLKDISVSADMSRLRLDLGIPQAMLKGKVRDSVSAESLDAGESMAFVNYNLSQYHVAYRQGLVSDLNSTYGNLNGGFNMGLWRYRQQSSYRYDADFGSHWDTSRRYVQRAILPWRSEALLGEGFTEGRFFSGLGFRGIQVSSDDRMLPDSLRGYAPVVRGVAKSNARVSILQGKSTLYETTVAPGPFAISDLYATNYSGDLTVIVTEADGSVNTFTVPFAAVPESIRPGFSRYAATVGRSRYIGNNDLFSELTWQHGLSNALTINAGNQLADGYQAGMLGGVYSSWLGAFGMDTTYSHATLPDGSTSGWMFHLSYSRTFTPTGTTLSIAGYRYSTEGFRDLSDVLGVRQATTNGENWQSDSYRQRSRFEAAINQGLGELGSLTMSGSTQDYRDQRGRDTQLQLGWGKTFGNGVALNLSVTRTRSLGNSYNINDYQGSNALDYIYGTPLANNTQTFTSFTLSFPLGSSTSAPSISLMTNHSQGQGSSYQATMSGNVGEEQPVSYGLNFSTDDNSKENTVGGNLQTRLPYANVTGSASSSRQYWQAAASLQGAVVAHRGGITLGPYVGDTFALIEAPGARGARVMDGQGSRVDRFGYALVPALVPYHYNTIALDPQGMSSKVDLDDGQQHVAPYAGAAVRLRFNTLHGQAVLVTAQHMGAIPMGTNVLDSSGKYVGMVGQANQIYLRSDKPEDVLTLSWGQSADQQCLLHYRLLANVESDLQRLTAPCR